METFQNLKEEIRCKRVAAPGCMLLGWGRDVARRV